MNMWTNLWQTQKMFHFLSDFIYVAQKSNLPDLNDLNL